MRIRVPRSGSLPLGGTGPQGRRGLHPAGLGVDERLLGLQRSHGGVPVEEGFRHQQAARGVAQLGAGVQPLQGEHLVQQLRRLRP